MNRSLDQSISQQNFLLPHAGVSRSSPTSISLSQLPKFVVLAVDCLDGISFYDDHEYSLVNQQNYSNDSFDQTSTCDKGYKDNPYTNTGYQVANNSMTKGSVQKAQWNQHPPLSTPINFPEFHTPTSATFLGETPKGNGHPDLVSHHTLEDRSMIEALVRFLKA